jgi:hypothetical protein
MPSVLDIFGGMTTIFKMNKKEGERARKKERKECKSEVNGKPWLHH